MTNKNDFLYFIIIDIMPRWGDCTTAQLGPKFWATGQPVRHALGSKTALGRHAMSMTCPLYRNSDDMVRRMALPLTAVVTVAFYC